MFAIQKIYMSGNSFVVTLERRLLHALQVMPGDFLKIEIAEGADVGTVRRFGTENATRRSPGVIDDARAPVKP